MELHETGAITRPAIGMNTASNNWIVTGAVTRNNFGHVTRRYSLADILSNPGAIPWQHGNGEQKTFIQDIDHGTPREWRNPTHSVI
jgi:hypothetical protein